MPFLEEPEQSSVSVYPGSTASTLNHDRSSPAREWKYPLNACLVAEYSALSGIAPRPPRLDTVTT